MNAGADLSSSAGMLRFNGTFTVTSPSGEHRTFRVRTLKSQSSESGTHRSVELLTGPDNETTYTAFGFIIPRRHVDRVGHAIVLHPGRSGGLPGVAYKPSTAREWFEGAYPNHEPRLNEWQRYAATLADLDARNGRLAAAGFRVLVAGVCRRCNRKLTVPESIESGIGPECAAKEDDG